METEELKTNGTDLRSEDQPVNMVYATDDLERFVFDDKNRAVNPAHVDKLQASVEDENLLEGQPILVNEKWIVIDGQHRLTVARNLGKTIYYIMKEGLTIEQAITLNINTKNWGYKDYLHYWTEQGKEEYIYFEKFMDQYGFSYTVALALLGLGQASQGIALTDHFNAGKFWPKYKDYAVEIAEEVQQLKEYGNFVTSRPFMLAYDKVRNVDEFDFDELVGKVEQVPARFERRSDVDRYLRMLEEVYNYNRRGEKVRFW